MSFEKEISRSLNSREDYDTLKADFDRREKEFAEAVSKGRLIGKGIINREASLASDEKLLEAYEDSHPEQFEK